LVCESGIELCWPSQLKPAWKKMINFDKIFKMKNLTLGLLFLSFVGNSFSQSDKTPALVWHEDLKEAVEVSKKENKPLMLFFYRKRLVWVVYSFAKRSFL
jgi:hypothetical protein